MWLAKPIDAGAGVGGFEAAGVGGLKSIGERAGEDFVRLEVPLPEVFVDMASLGAGSAIVVGVIRGVLWGVASNPLPCESAFALLDDVVASGPTKSTSMAPSKPFSNAAVFVSGSKPPSTLGRSSYRIGENRTPTLAFLWPGSWAIGGRAKFARE